VSYSKPDDLKTLLSAAERHYGAAHRQMRLWDDLYNRKFKGTISVPQNIPIFQSSTPTHAVDELRDQIRVDEPSVTAAAHGVTKESRKVQDLQAMAGRGWLYEAAREGLVNPYGQARHDLLLRGAGCTKEGMKRDHLRAAIKGEGMPRGFPFTVRAVDPLLLYPSAGTGPLRYMLEVQNRRVMDMWESYPNWSDPIGRELDKENRDNPLREVKWLEFWSWVPNLMDEWSGWYIVEVDGERVLEVPNPYGFVPYSYRYSGLGRANEDANPDKLAIGALWSLEGELREEVRLKTAMYAQWQFHVFPRLIAKGVPAKEVAAMLKVGPGGVLEWPKDGDANNPRWLEVPPPNQQMMESLARIESAISRKVSPALSGERTADYGIHQALQIGQAIKVIGPVRTSLNYLAAQSLEHMAKLVGRFDMTMTVRGKIGEAEVERKVTGATFNEISYEVTFEAVDPAENDRRMLAGLSVHKAGILSDETFWRKYAKDTVEDPDEEAGRIMAEQLQKQLIATGAMLPVVLEQYQLDQTEQQVQDASGQARKGGAEATSRRATMEGVAGQGATGGSEEATQEGQTQGGI